MSQKTGDSYAMPSISYPDETRRDIASNSPSLSLSLSHTRRRARVHDAYTTPARRARARAHNSPRALARRPVLLAPRRNRGPRTSPNYDTVRSATIHGRVLFWGREGRTGRRRRERRDQHGRTTDRGVHRWSGTRGVDDEGRLDTRGERSRKRRKTKGEGCIFRPIYTLPSSSSSSSSLPRSSANAHKCIPISGRIFPGGTSGRKERVIGTST